MNFRLSCSYYTLGITSNFNVKSYSYNIFRRSAALPYPKHGRLDGAHGEPLCLYAVLLSFDGTGIRSKGFFRSGLSTYVIIETVISRSNRFVRAPFSGGGSNASHSAFSVPHLDVNADRG